MWMSEAAVVPAPRPRRESPTRGFAALADPVRGRIVELLEREELCVCHLVDELGIAQPLVSHHLKVLREAGLVAGQRYRYWTYYRLVPDGFTDLADRLASVGAAPGHNRRPCC
jgi:ArsR family transcriptional regulator, arsenate/arsenite/antimonite-responsive transcriptional repressor